MNKAFVKEQEEGQPYCPRCKSLGESVGKATLDALLNGALSEKRMIEDGAATYIYYPFGVSLDKPWIQGLPKNSAGLNVQDWNIYFALTQEVYVVDHPDRPEMS